MTMIIRSLTAAAFVLAVAGTSYAKKYESEWMPESEFKAFIDDLEQKGYWEPASYWVTEVSGRYVDGKVQYRFEYENAPSEGHYDWYWWFGQDEQTFEKRKKEYKMKGMDMVHEQSFALPGGQKLYQGVWHVLID